MLLQFQTLYLNCYRTVIWLTRKPLTSSLVVSLYGPRWGRSKTIPSVRCFLPSVQATLLNLQSPLVLGSFDDLTLGKAAAGVAADVETIDRECREMGLFLNHAKCELITHSVDAFSLHC